MNIIKFKELHLNLSVILPRSFEINNLPSDTDPTQDLPIKSIQFTAGGMPINCTELKSSFSNVKIENMSSIERRNTDKFDKVGELQELSSKLNKSNATTNFVAPKKDKKNVQPQKNLNENEK